jgi:hypothetical protein
MKTKFAWYLNSTSPDPDLVWKSAVLTVDANVLLDLYRYHTTTRDSILSAITAFDSRVWVSNQAASEFFRNRKRVIASSEKTFSDARSAVEELKKVLDSGLSKLRGVRLVPRSLLDALNIAVSKALEDALTQISDASDKHPNYLRQDPILERLLAIFDGRLGDEYDAERLGELIQIADKRIKAKQPPGYMDEVKEGDRKYGDFLLWSQIKDFAKVAKSPMILVTSEQKEDWWEKASGRTLGPRLELIKEFVEETGQQVFIYQTDHFLELYAEHAGERLKADVFQEIRELRERRTRAQLPAVNVEHLPHVATPNVNLGTLEIELIREVRVMTGSGHLDPQMAGVPEVRATVTSKPVNCPPIDVRGATGTIFDFNVHIRPIERERTLPVGRYVIEYECIHEPPNSLVPDDDTTTG